MPTHSITAPLVTIHVSTSLQRSLLISVQCPVTSLQRLHDWCVHGHRMALLSFGQSARITASITSRGQRSRCAQAGLVNDVLPDCDVDDRTATEMCPV